MTARRTDLSKSSVAFGQASVVDEDIAGVAAGSTRLAPLEFKKLFVQNMIRLNIATRRVVPKRHRTRADEVSPRFGEQFASSLFQILLSTA